MASTLLVASVAVFYWTIQGPASPAIEAIGSVETGQLGNGAKTNVTRPLSDFEDVWERPLTAPLFDATAQTKPKKDRTTPRRNRSRGPAGIRLIGTVLESGHSLAMLVDTSGNIHVRGVGEAIELRSGNAEVERIEYEEVSLVVNGKPLTLRMQ